MADLKLEPPSGVEQAPSSFNTTRKDVPKFVGTPSVGPSPERLVLQKRARKKAVSQALARRLLALPQTGDMRASYLRQTQCGEQILQGQDGTLKQYWCGSRSCISCSSIRTAKFIHNYGEEVSSWPDSYMVTLTIPNVSRFLLRSAVKKMMADFRNLVKYLNYHHGKGVKILRTTEVTFNEDEGTFHPHFHLIINGYLPGRDAMKKWVKMVPGASILAQDIRKTTRDGKEFLELFKYATKLISTSRDENGRFKVIPAWALHEMLGALKGIKLISAVGFSAKKKEVEEEGPLEELEGKTSSPVRVGEEITWDWASSIFDWADWTTGELLSFYDPTPRARDFLQRLQEE